MKKLVNLVDGGCSKSLCLSSLFGFNSDCCGCSSPFVDDGLEPDHRPKNLIRRNHQPATTAANRLKPKQYYATVGENDEQTKIRKPHRIQTKKGNGRGGTIRGKQSTDRTGIGANSKEPLDWFKLKEPFQLMDDTGADEIRPTVDGKTNGRRGTFDLSKSVDAITNSFQAIAGIRNTPIAVSSMTNEQPYLLIDKSGKDQQKLSLFNANDYVKQLNAVQRPHRATLTIAGEDGQMTSDDEFFLQMDERLMKLSAGF